MLKLYQWGTQLKLELSIIYLLSVASMHYEFIYIPSSKLCECRENISMGLYLYCF